MTKLVYALFLLWSIAAFTQQDSQLETIPLTDLIPLLEERYGIQCSFINEHIEQKTVTLNLQDYPSIQAIIPKLEHQTQLHFELSKGTYLIIKKRAINEFISVCGYIRNADDTPVANVEIFLKKIRQHVYTDKNGYFHYANTPYNSVLLLGAKGYTQKILNATSYLTKCPVIYLSKEHDIEDLDEVLVKEYLTKGITKDNGSIHIDLKTFQSLAGLTEPDILQSLQQAPGINSPFETATGVYVRGSTPHQNLILWNGIKTYQQGHLFGLLSAFNPYAIKEVNFTKNGIPAHYGDRIASIIDIKTENEVADTFTGSAGVNMINADAVLHAPIIKDKLSVQVSGRRSFTDAFKTFTYSQFADRVFQNTKIEETTPQTLDKNDFFFWDYNVNLIGKFSDHSTIEANTIYSKNSLDFSRSLSSSTFNDLLTTENEGYNLLWKHRWNSRWSHQVSGYYTRYLLNYEFIDLPETERPVIEGKKNSIKDFGANTTVSYRITDAHQFNLGYQYTNNNTEHIFTTSTRDYQLTLDQKNDFLQTHSAYLEYDYTVPKNIKILTGIRYNAYLDLQKNVIEPRIFVQKNLTRHWTLNASGAYITQSTSKIKESIVSDLTLENQIWILSDEERFPLITSEQYALGSTYKRNRWTLDVEGYYKKIENLTSLTAGFINPVDNTFRMGNSTIMGIDFFLKKRIKNYHTWVSYSFINTQNQFEEINNNETFPGNWNIRHTVKWSHFYTYRNFQCALGWTWHTGKAFTDVTNVNRDEDLIILEYDAINGNTLPVYHRLDFSALYHFKIRSHRKTRYQIGVSVLNLYDRKNIINREFNTSNTLGDQNVIDNTVISLGITPNLSLRAFW